MLGTYGAPAVPGFFALLPVWKHARILIGPQVTALGRPISGSTADYQVLNATRHGPGEATVAIIHATAHLHPISSER